MIKLGNDDSDSSDEIKIHQESNVPWIIRAQDRLRYSTTFLS